MSKSQWINVNKRLPEQYVDVLGYIDLATKTKGYCSNYRRLVMLTEDGWTDEWGHENLNVVLWAPILQPPEQKD